MKDEFAMITSLPEVTGKIHKQMIIPYKLGNITIIVDIMGKLSNEVDFNNLNQEGIEEFMKNSHGKIAAENTISS